MFDSAHDVSCLKFLFLFLYTDVEEGICEEFEETGKRNSYRN